MKRSQNDKFARWVKVNGVPVTEDVAETLDLLASIHQQKIEEKRLREELNKRGVKNILFMENPNDRSPERLNRALKIIESAVEVKEF